MDVSILSLVQAVILLIFKKIYLVLRVHLRSIQTLHQKRKDLPKGHEKIFVKRMRVTGPKHVQLKDEEIEGTHEVVGKLSDIHEVQGNGKLGVWT